MATVGLSIPTAPHDFPAATVPGVYRITLTPASAPPGTVAPIVATVPYGGSPIVASIPNVPSGSYTMDKALLDPSGGVLFAAASEPLVVPQPPPSAVTLNVPTMATVTITFPPAGAVG